MTILPAALVDVLRSQVERVAEIHRQDLRDGFGRVGYLPFPGEEVSQRRPRATRTVPHSSCNGSGPRPDSHYKPPGV